MYSYVVAGAPVPDGTERGGVFLFSFYAGCRTKREAMRALRADWADGCALRWKRAPAAFVFADLQDFPPGRNKQEINGDGNAGAAAFFVRQAGSVLAGGVVIGRSR
jgi:hypothetical protein